MRRILIGCTVVLAAIALAPTAYSQIILVKNVVANGGGPANNGTLSLNGTVGQPAIGLLTGTNMTHGVGFWFPIDKIGSVNEPVTPGYAADGNVLYQNFPNPFRSTTMIRFMLAQRSNVTLKVFNMPGQEITTLLDGAYESGEHQVELAEKLPSGTYFYQLQVGTTMLRRQMVVSR